MTIRIKVIALLAALFAVISAAQFVVQKRILLPSFAELERQAAKTDMERVAFAIRNDLEQLAISGRDWANWSATYAFVQHRNPAFVKDNLNGDTLKSLKVNAFAIVDAEGKFAWAGAIALDTGKSIDIDFITRGVLPPGHALRVALHDGTPVTGLLRTNQGPMLAALSPIQNGNGEGPHGGMLLLGRLLTAEEVMQIGARAQVHLRMTAVRQSESHPGTIASSPPAARATTLIEGEDTTVVIRDFVDVTGLPLVTMQIDVPRTISVRGRATIAYAAIFLVGAGAIALLLLVLALNRLVLEPLSRVTRHAVAIGHNDDLTLRLDLRRADELGELANEIDRMVERLAAARRELVDQSFNAGIAELSSEVLHSIGNALTPVSIQMSLLQEQLRMAPVGDMEIVLAELSGGASDAARTVHLQEFLRLAGQELARAITQARRDVEAMERHMQTIKKLFGEQLSFSRTSRVIETVRLPELLRLCADGLPDAIRQRLALEIDETLEVVGSIRIARTTLQRIFQILMQNAAEAVRDSGSDRGTLRVSSTVESGANGERLEICFTDDGVGIAPEHLTRIFEKGFSTHSRDGHFGVGLHWAANAIIALGGTIHVESPGRNRGATIQLILPLERSSAAAQAA